MHRRRTCTLGTSRKDGRGSRACRSRCPVYCVQCVDTYDRIGGNHFITRYAYHHGFFDGVERENGFGMEEQWDIEELGALNDGSLPDANNVDASTDMLLVYTKI